MRVSIMTNNFPLFGTTWKVSDCGIDLLSALTPKTVPCGIRLKVMHLICRRAVKYSADHAKD